MAKFTVLTAYVVVRRIVVDAEDPKEAAVVAKDVITDATGHVCDIMLTVYDGDVFDEADKLMAEKTEFVSHYMVEFPRNEDND